MDDTISRQEAIDALAKFVPYAICDESTESYTNGLTDAYNLICQLPSAQPEHWIPCSERLPEDRLYVLVTYKYEYGLIDNGITWYSETENKWNTSREVIAWMPLPAPYREEGERNE